MSQDGDIWRFGVFGRRNGFNRDARASEREEFYKKRDVWSHPKDIGWAILFRCRKHRRSLNICETGNRTGDSAKRAKREIFADACFATPDSRHDRVGTPIDLARTKRRLRLRNTWDCARTFSDFGFKRKEEIARNFPISFSYESHRIRGLIISCTSFKVN